MSLEMWVCQKIEGERVRERSVLRQNRISVAQKSPGWTVAKKSFRKKEFDRERRKAVETMCVCVCVCV